MNNGPENWNIFKGAGYEIHLELVDSGNFNYRATGL